MENLLYKLSVEGIYCFATGNKYSRKMELS